MKALSRNSAIVTFTQVALILWLFGSSFFLAFMGMLGVAATSSIMGKQFNDWSLWPICAVPFVGTFVLAFFTGILEKTRMNSIVLSFLLIVGTLASQVALTFIANKMMGL